MAWGPILIIEVDTIESLRADTVLPGTVQSPSPLQSDVIGSRRHRQRRSLTESEELWRKVSSPAALQRLTPDPIIISSS